MAASRCSFASPRFVESLPLQAVSYKMRPRVKLLSALNISAPTDTIVHSTAAGRTSACCKADTLLPFLLAAALNTSAAEDSRNTGAAGDSAATGDAVVGGCPPVDA